MSPAPEPKDPPAGNARPPLAEWFIRHPIGTVLLTIGLVLLGAIAYPLLPLAPLPEVELPTIQISGSLPGASPETMASAVATPLEVQLSGVPGTREMTSSSSLGSTTITMQFELTKNIDVAAQEVQAAINAAAGRLPSDMPSQPTWKKGNPNDSPILALGMQSELMTLEELSDLAEVSVARKLSQTNGVSEVNVYGQRKPALRVQASPERLAALGITFADIRQVLQAASVNQAKGAIYGSDRVSTLATNDQIFAPKDYGALIVAYHDGAPVFLRDVAKISIGAENEYVGSWQNGKPGMYIMVRRQPGANIVSTAEAVRAALPGIQRQLPASVTLEVLNDRTQNDPVVAARSRSDSRRHLCARDPGDGCVPAAALGDGHCRLRAGGCSHRNHRSDVRAGIQPQQSHARRPRRGRRIRGGRCHRGRREHPSTPGGRRVDAPGGATRRVGDRRHGHVDQPLARRGIHSAAADGRRRRATVPRVRGHAHRRHFVLGGRIADSRADAGIALHEAVCPSHRWQADLLGSARSGLRPRSCSGRSRTNARCSSGSA